MASQAPQILLGEPDESCSLSQADQVVAVAELSKVARIYSSCACVGAAVQFTATNPSGAIRIDERDKVGAWRLP
jgi:hypothetical protein